MWFDDSKKCAPAAFPTAESPEHPSLPSSSRFVGHSIGPETDAGTEQTRTRKRERTLLELAEAGFPGKNKHEKERLQKLAALLATLNKIRQPPQG